MLTEEGHHMFVGETGMRRVIERTVALMKQNDDVRKLGGIPLDIIQKYVNEWYSASLDLFGGEDSSNAANYFGGGLKGRWNEAKDSKLTDHVALQGDYVMKIPGVGDRVIPMRRAMNLVLRDSYVEDCQKVLGRWNKVFEQAGMKERITLPQERFNRHQGVYSERPYDIDGNPITQAEWDQKVGRWLPTAADYEYVQSLMKPVYEPGKFANWIAPPPKGINDMPIEYAYVKFADSKPWLRP
jgi:benzoyl-CoA 2,3-dioxygenase component B